MLPIWRENGIRGWVRPPCRTCDQSAHLKDERPVAFVNVRCFGRPTTLVWRRRRWRCPAPDCPTPSWTQGDDGDVLAGALAAEGGMAAVHAARNADEQAAGIINNTERYRH